MDYDVKKLSDEAVELLKQLISLPSVSREEQLALRRNANTQSRL